MKLCLAAGLGYPIPTEEQIPKIKAVGFDGIFTDWGYDLPIENWIRLVRDNGLIYQSFHAPFGQVWKMWEDGEIGSAVEKELCDCLSDAAKYGVPIVVAHAFIGFDRHEPTEIGIKRFTHVAEHARAVGVKLALENTEGEEYLAALMDALSGNPAVGFCIDTGHEMCYNRSQDMIGKYRNRVIATHLNDNMGIIDPDNITWHDDSHLLPFDGIANWKGIVSRLKAAGYTGPLTFELTSQNKPNRNTHDIYAGLSYEAFLALTYTHAQKVLSLWNSENN